MQHAKLTESFSMEDEHFFGSYEAEAGYAEGALAPAFDGVESAPPSAEQVAHLNRFRRPIAWVMAAMGSLSLVALGQHVYRQNSRREVVAQVGPASTLPISAAAKHHASLSAVPSRSVFASAAERTSEASWSWTDLAENALALVLEPTGLRASAGELPSLADSATSTTPALQAKLVNDFTSELLSMCRDVPV